jgi:hypothetical protein
VKCVVVRRLRWRSRSAFTLGVPLGYKAVSVQAMADLFVWLQFETSPKCTETKWLSEEYLPEHGFWIRAECLPRFMQRLGHTTTQRDKYCYRDIRIWLPHLEYRDLCRDKAMPCCPSCGLCDKTVPHSFPIQHPGRRVVCLSSEYYIITRQYKCTRCSEERKKTNDPKLQYTFVGHNAESMKRFPHLIREAFPAVLSHRSGLEWSRPVRHHCQKQ